MEGAEKRAMEVDDLNGEIGDLARFWDTERNEGLWRDGDMVAVCVVGG